MLHVPIKVFQFLFVTMRKVEEVFIPTILQYYSVFLLFSLDLFIVVRVEVELSFKGRVSFRRRLTNI